MQEDFGQKLPEKLGSKKAKVREVSKDPGGLDPLFFAQDKNSDAKIECQGCGLLVGIDEKCPNCDFEN